MAEFGAGRPSASNAGHRAQRGAIVGRPFFGGPFFGRSKKGASETAKRASKRSCSGFDFSNGNGKIKLDSGIRRNDDQQRITRT